jgi:ABC-type phosphate transport system substrate-binding protein
MISAKWMLAIVTALALRLAEPVRAEGFMLIVNGRNAPGDISKIEVRRLFTGGTKQWGGAMVQVVLPPDGNGALKWMASHYFGVSERDLLSKIKQEVFRGELHKPILAESDEASAEAVRRNPGGIGIVPAGKPPAGTTTLAVHD